MAYMRSLSTRANLLSPRYHQPFVYTLHDDDHKRNSIIDDGPSHQQGTSNCVQQRSFGTSFNSTSAGFGSLFQDWSCCSRFAFPPALAGASFVRNMASTTVGGVSNKIEVANVLTDTPKIDVADILTDATTQAVAIQAPAANEVAIAAADSFFPVAALQHLIDAIHSFSGLNWWTSIIVTALLIRGAMLPLLINQLKATSKLTLMRPHLEEIKQKVQNQGMDPAAVAEGQKEMQKLFKKHGVSPFTPLKGLFIQGPVFMSFFFAITNMVEKVPSFKNGGAYWFTDLTTTDSFYIFPILTALTFWITVECNMQEGMEGNPAAGTMKNVSRVLAVASVPLTMSFPKAIFCYWVTSNLFSLTYGLALKAPGVKKFLGVPEIPPSTSTSTAPQSSSSLFAVLKQARTAIQEPSVSSPVEPSKHADHRNSSSSSSVISQRIRSLERQVKGRKKNKKR